MPIRRRTALAITFGGLAAMALPAAAKPQIGQPAPAFQAVDADGRTRSLEEFKGKTVVLEWTNNGCPYVGKHYNSGNMQRLQRDAAKAGVVWLTIASSAPDMQGYVTGPQAKAWKAKVNAASTAILLDPNGRLGRTYDARVTPHMFVIDGAGKLVYMGGIDDKPSSELSSLKGATNYVSAALADVKAGRPVAQPVTRPYGCGVKYASAD